MIDPALQIRKWRADTPGTKYYNHLNNAGASLMPEVVSQAIKDHIDLESVTGGYEAAGLRSKAIRAFYENASRLFGTRPENIAFTANATDAYTRALSSIPFERGDVILTTSNDYVSNFVSFISLRDRFGIDFKIVDNTSAGELDLDALRRDIAKYHPKLVSITHIPTNSGLIQPVAEAGKICREQEVIYLVDGCQSAGQVDVDMETIGCDFFSATFRKFLRGPRGAGFLFVSDRILQSNLHPLMLDMRGADWIEKDSFRLKEKATRFEDWENSYALLLGASAALHYAAEITMPVIEKRVTELAAELRTRLSDIPGLTILDRGTKKGAIVTAHSNIITAEALKTALKQEKINCSFGNKLNALIDFQEKGVEWIVRLAPHYYNTREEIHNAAEVIERISFQH